MTKQLEIAGTERPDKNPDIERALDAWLEAKDEQKGSGERVKLRHSSLLIQMADAGIERYPYIDSSSGKRKEVVIARDPKAKTITAVRFRRDEPDDPGEEVTPPQDKNADKVEHRKVSRASVEKEIDPFGSTRTALEDSRAGILGDAEAAQNGEMPAPANGHATNGATKPKKSKSKRKGKR